MASYSRKEIEDQLAELRKVLVVAREYGTPDRASQIGMTAMLQQEAGLLDALKSATMAEAEIAAEVVIDGDPVRDHAISIAFLGQLLGRIQNLTNAIAQAQANVQTARGIIPHNLISRNRFELATVFESSFGFGLRLPSEVQEKLFIDDSDSPADIVCRLLDGQDLQPDEVAFLSTSRVRGHYALLIDLIGKQGATVAFRTLKYPRGSKINAQQSRDRSDWLSYLVITDEVITVEGTIVGGNIETKTFHIKGDNGEFYRGQLIESAVGQMLDMNLGAAVIARLQALTASHEEAELELRTTYRLLDIHRQDG